MTPHLDEALLHELVDGEVPSSALGPIQAHLAACPECRGRLEEARTLAADADRFLEALDEPDPERVPEPRRAPARRFGWGASIAWAATLVIAAGLGYYARGGVPEPVQEGTTLPAPAAAAEAPAPAPTPAPASIRAERKVAAPPAQRNEQPVEPESRRAEPIIAPRTSAVPAPTPALAARDQAMASGIAGAAKAAEATAPDTLSFIDAMERMRGSLRTIEGLVPLRLEAVGAEVRVIYPAEGGQLVLTQRWVDGRVRWQLLAPQGFPADSLAKLRARVRE